MKLLRQFAIILLITCLGELLRILLPLPIPASIYGMAILFAALSSGILPLASIQQAGNFLIEIMPILFVPAAAALLDSWGLLKPILIPVSIIVCSVTVLVMAVTGRVAQYIIRRGTGGQGDA